MVREMIVRSQQNQRTEPGAVWFLYERQNNHQAMAGRCPGCLRVNMQCAQCHNHPLVWEIEQRIMGTGRALNRSKAVQTASAGHDPNRR